MSQGYPKQITLKNGETAVLRPLAPDDEAGLISFFTSLPPESTQYLKHQVSDPEVTRSWVRQRNPDLAWSILALTEDKRVIGDATLLMVQSGWRRHIGEVRVVVAPEYEHQRLATKLIHELVNQASLRSLRKLEAQILDIQEGARRAFEKLGFVEAARLRGHAIDLNGREHDLLILTNTVDDLWRKMENLISDTDFAGRDGDYS